MVCSCIEARAWSTFIIWTWGNKLMGCPWFDIHKLVHRIKSKAGNWTGVSFQRAQWEVARERLSGYNLGGHFRCHARHGNDNLSGAENREKLYTHFEKIMGVCISENLLETVGESSTGC